MMAYLLSDLWIEMKYRLIKLFIVLLEISDSNLFTELTVQCLRHYWFLIPSSSSSSVSAELMVEYNHTVHMTQ